MKRIVVVRQKASHGLDWKVSNWFGHVERMIKKVYELDVEGTRVVGRPCARWLNGLKIACSARCLAF